jgi:ABC-type dipeptide/oligopeptide/nickel transport system ATPase subunit
MAVSKERVFEDHAAQRGPTPLLFGLIGPSGSGKTFSALRLATGIQRIVGGDIWGIDTESRRMLHYAEKFKFRHVPFGAPFSSLDYLAAIEHCVNKGAKTIIVDSMSHEHEGPGGLLEMHQAETERLAQLWKTSAAAVQLTAWNKPKQERRRLINTVIQLDCNFIFCFRAKEKLKIVKGRDPENLGFMPIAGEEFVYELTGKALLMPGARGVPTWNPHNEGEKMMTKLPEQFVGIFTGAAGKPLDEDVGEQLAKWAVGGTGNPFADEYLRCTSKEAYDALEKRRAELWAKATAADKKLIKTASDAAARRIAEQPVAESVDENTGEILTLNGDPPDHDAAAIQRLVAAWNSSPQALRSEWAKIMGEYAERNADVPIPVEAKYLELRDAAPEVES